MSVAYTWLIARPSVRRLLEAAFGRRHRRHRVVVVVVVVVVVTVCCGCRDNQRTTTPRFDMLCETRNTNGSHGATH